MDNFFGGFEIALGLIGFVVGIGAAGVIVVATSAASAWVWEKIRAR